MNEVERILNEYYNNYNEDERLIKVEWNNNATNTYESKLNILINNSNFLVDLMSLATKLKIMITEIKNKETENGLICNLTLKVKDREELEYFKNQINKFKDVKIME